MSAESRCDRLDHVAHHGRRWVDVFQNRQVILSSDLRVHQLALLSAQEGPTHLHGDEVVGEQGEDLRSDVGDPQVADELWVVQGELSSDWVGLAGVSTRMAMTLPCKLTLHTPEGDDEVCDGGVVHFG